MTKFNVGDRVRPVGYPPEVQRLMTVEVLELGTCEEDPCSFGGDTFSFIDPESGERDEAHVSEFERVP
jgi:hypothetical protein